MVQFKGSALLTAAAVFLICSEAKAQVTWGGDFPDDNFNSAANWVGGTTPLNNGTEVLQFNSSGAGTMILNVPANFLEIDVTATNGGANVDIAGSNALTLGANGLYINSDDGSSSLTLDVPVHLAASQEWGIGEASGSLTVNGVITGAFSLALAGDNNFAQFFLNSGASNFTGGVTLSGLNSSLTVGASSTGPGDAPTAGPVGTGPLVLGYGTTLTAPQGTPVTLANTIFVGDTEDSNSVTFGNNEGYQGSPPTNLTLTGTVTIAANESTSFLIAENSVITFAGPLTAALSGPLSFDSFDDSAFSWAILQGNISNITGIQVYDETTVIFDGASPAQVQNGLTSILSQSNSYVGMGRGYSSAGGVATFMGLLDEPGFTGTLGFDTTSGGTVVFNDPVDLTIFPSSEFVGLGSATKAILGPSAIITPVNNGSDFANYPFGGGGGTLTVQSPLVDYTPDDPIQTSLSLSSGNAPLTLVLSGALSYTGSTQVDGGALIFDSPLPPGNLSLFSGYIGVTANAGYAGTEQSFINLFGDTDGGGVIGFDSLTGQYVVTSAINMAPLFGDYFLGTATSVDYQGAITPYNNTFQFSGVKGGQVTVSTQLMDSGPPASVVVGLPYPIESYNSTLGYSTVSSVTLSGDNSYSGGTTLNSGYLYVTNGNSIGTGTLSVPSDRELGWGGSLVALNPVTLQNPIAIGYDGLALNYGSTKMLTLTGTISDLGDGSSGELGIFGPVTIMGDNTYSDGTFIQGATVYVQNDFGLGFESVQAMSSTLNFTTGAPEICGLSLTGSTATFSGSPIIEDLQMAQSTINFGGSTAEIDGLFSDSAGSGNVINLTGTTLLTISVDGGEDENNGSTFHGTITGSTGSLLVEGPGNLNLAGANSYGGGTTIDTDAVIIASNNSALGSGPVFINNGAILAANNGITLTNPLNLSDGAILAGFGTFAPGSNIVIQNGSGVAPGSFPVRGSNIAGNIPVAGTLSFAPGTSLEFAVGGYYGFAFTDASAAAGVGYGTINMPGSTLNISANSGNPFTIELFSFDTSGDPSATVNFSSSVAGQWTLVSAGSILNFNPTSFVVDATSAFSSPDGLGTGHFYVSQSGNNLELNFTPVPEPSTWALIAGGLLALGLTVRRRRLA